jgi:DNA polymerase I
MVYLIDGFNLMFRSYYAIPELTRSDGFPTNAIHGWIKTIWSLQDRPDCDRMIVFFDRGASAREALLPEYKANRAETPDALRQQIPEIKRLTRLLGLPVVEEDGVEADDLIASCAHTLGTQGQHVVIVSADKDFAQCLNASIQQLLPPPTANPKLGWRMLTVAGIPEKFGVEAGQIADYLALVGDSSDNIPGLAGVGPKTAAKWLGDYGSIEGIIAKANYLQPARFQSLVANQAEVLRRNLQLTQVDTRLSMPSLQAQDLQAEQLLAFLESMEMHRTVNDAKKRLR